MAKERFGCWIDLSDGYTALTVLTAKGILKESLRQTALKNNIKLSLPKLVADPVRRSVSAWAKRIG